MNSEVTLVDAIRYFSQEQHCIDLVASLRWPKGIPVCPHCQSEKNYWFAAQHRWKCAKCRKQFSIKVGTIFEDSPIPLHKWLTAMWMLANCKNGISSYEISRDLGLCQKSAWFLLQRIRLVMTDELADKLGGQLPVQIDETFVGGKVKNMHKSKRKAIPYQGQGNKAVVLGMLERGGRVRAKVIADRYRKTIDAVVSAHVAEGSTIHTDEFSVYPNLTTEYIHEVVSHADGYVKGHITTNGVENFWALLKRCLGGTYVSVEPAHLQRYVAEQVWRFNNRKDKKDSDRFVEVLSQVAGKRLTYAELIGKVDVRPN